MASPTKGFSLVKYDTPILVSKALTGKNKNIAAAKSHNSSAVTSSSSNRSKEDISGMRTEDYLNSILPPREY